MVEDLLCARKMPKVLLFQRMFFQLNCWVDFLKFYFLSQIHPAVYLDKLCALQKIYAQIQIIS